MPFVLARCTQCGANIDVDDSKETAFCPQCGTAFVTEKVITNYDTTVNNNFDIKSANIIASVVNEDRIESQTDSALIRAEQLYQIGEVEESVNMFIAYTDKFPRDWKTQLRLADICEGLIKKYGPRDLAEQRMAKVAKVLDFVTQAFDGTNCYVDTVGDFSLKNGMYAYCVSLRERMLKFALLSAPKEMHTEIKDRLDNVVITPQNGVQKKNEIDKGVEDKKTKKSRINANAMFWSGLACLAVGALVSCIPPAWGIIWTIIGKAISLGGIALMIAGFIIKK